MSRRTCILVVNQKLGLIVDWPQTWLPAILLQAPAKVTVAADWRLQKAPIKCTYRCRNSIILYEVVERFVTIDENQSEQFDVCLTYVVCET